MLSFMETGKMNITPVIVVDRNGRNTQNIVRWEAIDVSVNDYDPGESFYILNGGAGVLAIVGEGMQNIAAASIPLLPLTVGEHPIRCIKVLVNAGNTATDLFAMFTEL